MKSENLRKFVKSINNKNIPKIIELDGNTLNLDKLKALELGNHKIALTSKSEEKILQSRKLIENICVGQETVYGVNTGFGKFSNVNINNNDLEQLQLNIIRSHATGAGHILPLNQARRIHSLRINTLAKGYSGASITTIKKLIEVYNAGIVPHIPLQGTVGASGDLVPLSHIALGIIGEGLLWNPKSKKYEAADKVLKQFSIAPAQLKAKDGLSLINGTQFITGIGSIALENSINLIRAIHPIATMSLCAMKNSPLPFDHKISMVRPHPGQLAISEIMTIFSKELVKNLKPGEDCQDAYSSRCIPQVHGPVLEAIWNIKETFDVEMNSSTDNPLVFENGEIISGGNFHAEFVAKALDMLGIYVHELGNISYSRIMRLLNKEKNNGLSTFLTYNEGLCSGMMTYENLAASLVSENKVKCHPSSVDSLPTCADKEDHVSMGGYSARKAVSITENVTKIFAVELMSAAKGIEMRKRIDPHFHISKPIKNLYEIVNEMSPPFGNTDRYCKPEYDTILEYIESGKLWEDVYGNMSEEFSVNTKI
jgi:histidine ammonia-lyase